MTPGNYLRQLQMLTVGGNGFNKQLPLTPNGCATTGTRATATNSVPADAIVLDADGEDVIVGSTIPLDYDQESDLLDVALMVRNVSGTSNTLQASDVSRGRVGTDIVDEAGFTPATATLVNAAFDIGLVSANLSGLTWLAGDVFHVNFATAATTSSGIMHVVGAVITYRSVLVAYKDANRGNEDTDTSTNHLN